MSRDRRTEIVRHLDEGELDRLLRLADDPKVTKRLTFLKRLYKGENLEDAADDVGKSASTGSRWARRWNEGGLGLLKPNFGAGRPPKLGEEHRNNFLRCCAKISPGKRRKSSNH
jgi:transposase